MKESGIRSKVLWWAAKRLVNQYRPTVIAIGGGIAKTSTKYTVGAVIESRFPQDVLVGYGNLNSYIGVPLSILGIKMDFHKTTSKLIWLILLPQAVWRAFTTNLPKYLVLEYGTDHPGDIVALTRQLSPDIAVLTIVAPAHVENYGSLEKVAEDEGALLESVAPEGTVFVNKLDPYFQQHLSRIKTKNVITVELPNEDLAEGYARAVGKHFGVPDSEITEILKTVVLPKHRFAQEQFGDYLVLDDSYNANPASMEAALRRLEKLPGRKVAILGTMRELGNNERTLHRHIGNLAHEIADVVVGVGDLAEEYKPDTHFPSSDSAAEGIFPYLKKGDSILVKGSKSVHMENIVNSIRNAVS